MKILVDKLPSVCGKCEYCADAVLTNPFGVEEQVSLCTIYMMFVPQDPTQKPHTINKELSPAENSCIFKPSIITDNSDDMPSTSSPIILE